MKTIQGIPTEARRSSFFFFLLVTVCLYLSIYLQPGLDDFCFGHSIQNFPSLWANVHHEWTLLDGRWATSAIRYLFYGYIGLDNYYWLTTLLSLLMLFLGSWFISKILYDDISRQLTSSFLFTTIFIAIASKVQDLLFWGNGLINYTFGYGLTALSIYLFYSLSKSNRVNWLFFVVLMPVIFLVSGMAELFLMPLWFYIALMLYRSDNKARLIPIVIIAAIGTALSLFAPGNESRALRVDNSIGFSELISETFIYGLRGILLPCFALYLISHLPIVKQAVIEMSNSVTKRFDQASRLTITFFALSYPAMMVFVLLLSLGAPGPGRAHNLSLFVIVLCWPVIISILGFLKPSHSRFKALNIVLIVLGLTVLLGQNIRELLEDIISGDAKGYSLAMADDRVMLNNLEPGQDVVLQTKTNIPNIGHENLYFATHDKNYWINQCVAYYFNLNSITVNK